MRLSCSRYCNIYSFTHSLTHSLTHPLTSGEHLQISESIIGKMQSNLYTSALYSGRPPSVKRPVFKVPIFRSYKHCMFKEKTDNIFLFNAPFLFVISLNRWLQIDIGETWSLWRTWLLSTWLKICSNIYQSWCVKSACFTMYLPASQML